MATATSRARPPARASEKEPDQVAPPQIRAITMPGVHEAVHRAMSSLPRGSLLDVGAGQGAFSLWATQQGFDVTAVDGDANNFRAPGINCVEANLNQPWPFEDDQFDTVVSIEVLEHVENHYAFLRECCRVCKPEGRIVFSTPNCHSIESRLNYLLTGYDDCAPRPIDHQNPKHGSIYMEHIHPAPISTIELGLRMNGFEIERMNFSRRRKASTLLLPLVYPFMWWRTYRQMILSERNPDLRQRNRGIMKVLLNPSLLTGRVAVYTCRKLKIGED
ncbi:MAG TPA: class I SAM-dependent methyltransferase [Pirellulales bacterium]|nr:class I SAM-dependent methyltransferase [Pirellulales bacterium]